MSFTVDGLASGLDTSSIIRQLMQIERQPVVRLQSRQQTFQSRVNAWGSIETALDKLQSAVRDLRKVRDFQEFKATSSDETVFTATAGSSAARGTLSFTVENLAAAHQQISQGFADSTTLTGAGVASFATGLATIDVTSVDASTGGLPTAAYTIEVKSVDTGAGTAVIAFNGVEQTVSNTGTVTLTGDDGSISVTTEATGFTVGTATVTVVNTDASTTLADLRSAINTANGGVSATLLNTGAASDPYKLVLTAGSTGTDNALTTDVSGLSAFSSPMSTLRAAADATLTIGGGTQTITRSSNTITDLLDGVTLNLVAADPGTEVTVDVANDTDAVTTKVQKLVDAVNDVMGQIRKYAKYDIASQKGGPLVGDLRIRQVQAAVQDALAYTDTSLAYGYASALGISVDAKGVYSLDSTKLKAALDADYDDVVEFFTEDTTAGRDGLMGTLYAALDPILTAGGLLDTAKDGAQDTVDDLKKRIAAFEDRLVLMEERYRKQFTALETALGQLSNQSRWLGAQLSSLVR